MVLLRSALDGLATLCIVLRYESEVVLVIRFSVRGFMQSKEISDESDFEFAF